MLKQLHLKSLFLLLCIVAGVNSAWAEDPDVTYDFTGNDWTVESGKLSNGTVTFSGEGSGSFKMNSGYFMLGKNGAYINFPTYEKSVEKIVVTGRSGASGSVVQNIYVGETEVSTATTGATGTNTYKIGSGYQTAGTQYTLKVTSNHNTQITKIEIFFGSDAVNPDLKENDLALGSSSLSFDLYNNNTAQVINYTTNSTGEVTVSSNQYVSTSVDASAKTITVSPLKKTSGEVEITVSQAADDSYAAGSATFTVTIDDSTPKSGAWVSTSLTDLTADDVFVIVGNNSNNYALSNDNGTGSAPAAVSVTVVNNEITSDVADNVKWNISGNSTDGYTFYPNGSTNTWLYCTNTNNGIRVGNNNDKTFVIKDEYLYHSATYRYVGVYNSSDWRCYTSINANIKDQTFAFYKYEDNASVKAPVIAVEETFIGSTTATISCATEGATIYYSYDKESWTEYTEALTITATTTIYAKATKGEDESKVVSKTTTKVLPTPTVTIDATGITNTNVFDGVGAGSLSATVTYNDETLEGASVTWSGNNDEVATIDAETGAVTLVAAGSVTFTATYAGNSDYSESTATYQMTVTNSDPNVPGTENNPYTVAEARAAIDAETGVTGVYAKGIVSEIVTPYNSQYGNISYNISVDGLTTSEQLQAYRGLSYDGEKFGSEDAIQVGDAVVIYGNLKKYNSTYEFEQGNQLVSLVRKVAIPTFSPEAGAVAAGTKVTINCATDGATIYYTTDGTDPTTESTEYTEAITVNDNMTIKVLAVKNGYSNSEIATAVYTIAVPADAPTFSLASGTYEGTQNVTLSTTTEGATIYYTTDGTEPTTSSTVYTEAIEVNETMTIKAIAVKDGMANSAVAEATYTILLPDYATLPFTWNDETTPIGITNNGVGTYKSSPYLKFADTGAYIVLKINEVPGILSFDIKGNSFSGGTFTVQTSADGKTYADLETYTKLGTTQTEKFLLDENVRYIKWIYTEKLTGNVALGNIKLAKPVAPVAFTISDAKYATFSSEHVLDFSASGVTVYTGKYNGTSVTLTEVESGKVPANTAVILYAETAGDYTANVIAKADALENNDLLVSDGNVTGGDNIYALANKNSKVGFYNVSSEVTIPAGKAYLNAAGAGAREFIGFAEDETTSIASVKAAVDNSTVYNMQGQRVAKAAKGLYIVNGKKMVIK